MRRARRFLVLLVVILVGVVAFQVGSVWAKGTPPPPNAGPVDNLQAQVVQL
jgi:hypothetical protein